MAHFSIKDCEDMPKGDAIIRDHQVDAGTSLSGLVGFVGGKFRIVEKTAFSEAYTVLLFSFSSSGLTTACVKLIATSRLTEERLKSYPSKIKIVSDGRYEADNVNPTMVKRVVLFEQALPFEVKHNNPNVLVSQGEECHIKSIAVHETNNSNVVVFVTENMPIPCYLADENNQCDCRYVLAKISGLLRGEPCRELSQKLQYDCTASTAPERQCDALHVCMFCGEALIRPTQCGRICDDKFTKKFIKNRPISRTFSNLRPKSKKRRKNPLSCCVRKRRRKDQSDAYILNQTTDHGFVDYDYNCCRPRCKVCNKCILQPESKPCPEFRPQPVCKPYPEFKPQPECKPFPEFTLQPECNPCPEYKPCPKIKPCPEYKTVSECKLCPGCKQIPEYKTCESQPCCTSCPKYNCEDILSKECYAAIKGCVASTEYCTSDTQTELPTENSDYFLICQAYKLKSDKHASNKYNRKKLEEQLGNTPENSKRNNVQSQRDHVHNSKEEKWSSYLTRFNASDKSSEASTKSTPKQLSSEDEIKEISIQSTESYLVAQSYKTTKRKDKNLFIGRMEGSSFQTYPFRNLKSFVECQYGTAESYDRARKFPSVSSTNSNSSYLCIGQRREPK